jgi:chromosome segregation ATPase
MLEKQLIELNEDLQTLENDKNELNDQIDELKEQLQSKDRQIQTFEVSKNIDLILKKKTLIYFRIQLQHLVLHLQYLHHRILEIVLHHLKHLNIYLN